MRLVPGFVGAGHIYTPCLPLKKILLRSKAQAPNQLILIILCYIFTQATLIVVFVLELIGGYEDEAKICDYIFSLLPTHCLSRSLMVMATNDATREFCKESDV